MYSLPRVSRSASRRFTRSLQAPSSVALRPYFLASSCFTAHPNPKLSPVRFSSSYSTMTDTNQGGDSSKKTYHNKATGNALTTVKNHAKEEDLKLYGSCFWYVIITFAINLVRHANFVKSLRPARLDISRAQKHSLPVHRSRSVQEAPISSRREPPRSCPRHPPRSNMEHPRVHRHYGVPRGPELWRIPSSS
jgi:hypothetical protein